MIAILTGPGAETLRLEIGHRFVDPFGRYDLVPHKQRSRTVLPGGFGELGAQRLEIFGRRLPVPGIRRAAGGKDGQQRQGHEPQRAGFQRKYRFDHRVKFEVNFS